MERCMTPIALNLTRQPRRRTPRSFERVRGYRHEKQTVKDKREKSLRSGAICEGLLAGSSVNTEFGARK